MQRPRSPEENKVGIDREDQSAAWARPNTRRITRALGPSLRERLSHANFNENYALTITSGSSVHAWLERRLRN